MLIVSPAAPHQVSKHFFSTFFFFSEIREFIKFVKPAPIEEEKAKKKQGGKKKSKSKDGETNESEP